MFTNEPLEERPLKVSEVTELSLQFICCLNLAEVPVAGEKLNVALSTVLLKNPIPIPLAVLLAVLLIPVIFTWFPVSSNQLNP
jgi:hypothetical protein